MTVYQLIILNDILDIWTNRKRNLLHYIELARNGNEFWVQQQLEECNNKINEVQNLINEQICLLARATRPPPPAL